MFKHKIFFYRFKIAMDDVQEKERLAFHRKKDDWNFFLRLAIFNGDVVDISHQSSATKGSLQPDSRSSHKQNKPVPLDVQENPGLLTENETCQFCFNEFFRFVICLQFFSSIEVNHS